MLLKDLYFPLVLLPSTAVLSVARAPGCIDLMELTVTIHADMSDPCLHSDPGSRLWLISNALDTTTEQPDRTSNQKTAALAVTDSPSHPYNTNDDDEELPEDRFHRKDASSSYILQQREEGLSKAKSKRAAAADSDKVILNEDEDDDKDKRSENDVLRYSVSFSQYYVLSHINRLSYCVCLHIYILVHIYRSDPVVLESESDVVELSKPYKRIKDELITKVFISDIYIYIQYNLILL